MFYQELDGFIKCLVHTHLQALMKAGNFGGHDYVRTCVILLYLDRNFMVKKVSHNWLFIFSYDYCLKH